MGDSYSAQRGLWKIGTAHVNNNGPTTQNDISVILNTTNNPSIAMPMTALAIAAAQQRRCK